MSSQHLFQVVILPAFQTLGIFSSLQKAKDATLIYKQEFDDSTIINIYTITLDNIEHADLNTPLN